MGKQMICASCGASFDDGLAKCPYCGSINISGAEKEYFKTLEGVREELEDLDDAPAQELKETFQKQGRKFWKLLVPVFVLAAASVGWIWYQNRPSGEDHKSRYLWEQENFPALDGLYESGSYDEMAKAADSLLEQEENSLYNWEHYDFYEVYSLAVNMEKRLEERSEGSLSSYDSVDLFYEEWYLVCAEAFQTERKKENLTVYTEREMEALSPYIEKARQDLKDSWGLTEQQYQEFLSLARGNYYRVPWERCDEYVTDWLEREE